MNVLNLGEIQAGAFTVDFPFWTDMNGILQPLVSGALRCYKGANPTQYTGAALTLSANHDSVDGFHMGHVDLSDAFFVNATDYTVVYDAGTVLGVPMVGQPVAYFSLRNRRAAAPSEVNAEVVDAIAVDTYAEPGQGAPPATTTLAAKINYEYKSWRNKKTNDGSQTNLFNDAGSTVDQKQATSSGGGTVTKDEWVTGP